MVSGLELTDIQDDSIQENLLHLLKQICPKEEGEPIPAYKAFCNWATTDSSITKLATGYREQPEAPTTEIDVLRAWAEQYGWTQRLKEWSPIYAIFQNQQFRRRENEILERWNNRRQKLLDVADQLLARAELMLKHPYVEKIICDEVVADCQGQIIPTTIVIKPIKWQSSDVAAFQKTALALLKECVGDREIAIDRLVRDGFVVTDPTRSESDVNQHMAALEQFEQLQEGFL